MIAARCRRARPASRDWQIVLAGALIGDGGPREVAVVKHAFARIIKTIRAASDVSLLLAFNREGDPVILEAQ